jgi:hypothetical protein
MFRRHVPLPRLRAIRTRRNLLQRASTLRRLRDRTTSLVTALGLGCEFA